MNYEGENMIVKFRAWHKKEKKMYKMGTNFLSLNWQGWHLISSLTGESLVSNKNGILMQSTGLKDKNGKKIFEGDILKLNSKGLPRWVGQIKKFSGGLIFIEEDDDENRIEYTGVLLKRLADKTQKIMEVIGNIYENPKLLKVKK
jgi:uncharacterized phage protein (TIGR01671 family)